MFKFLGGIFKWVGGFVVVIIIVGAVLSNKKDEQKQSKQNNTTQPSVEQTPKIIISVTAKELTKDYDDNTVAADKKYKGQQYRVTGRVLEIGTNFADDPYITMSGHKQFNSARFDFDKNKSDGLEKIKKGDQISLVCEGEGDILKMPRSKHCELSQ